MNHQLYILFYIPFKLEYNSFILYLKILLTFWRRPHCLSVKPIEKVGNDQQLTCKCSLNMLNLIIQLSNYRHSLENLWESNFLIVDRLHIRLIFFLYRQNIEPMSEFNPKGQWLEKREMIWCFSENIGGQFLRVPLFYLVSECEQHAKTSLTRISVVRWHLRFWLPGEFSTQTPSPQELFEKLNLDNRPGIICVHPFWSESASCDTLISLYLSYCWPLKETGNHLESNMFHLSARRFFPRYLLAV